MSIDLHSNCKTSFYANLIKMLNYYNIPFYFNHDNLNDTKILHCVDHMQKNYITHWKHSLCNSQKLEFYNVFKDSYTPSIYLDVTRKNPNRKTLVKLRISSNQIARITSDFKMDLIKKGKLHKLQGQKVIR